MTITTDDRPGTDLPAQLRAAGLRVTASRVAVLEAVDSRPHSSAATVLSMVATTLPGTSPQAVHNVVSDLTTAGLLRRIEPAGSAARYERRTGDNHHHLVCRDCGRIEDVDCAVGAAPCLVPSDPSGFAVDEAEVTFWGTCPACLTASTDVTTSAPAPHRTQHA